LQLGGDLLPPNNTRVDGVNRAWDRFGDFAAGKMRVGAPSSRSVEEG
jgi:hypothetical protein